MNEQRRRFWLCAAAALVAGLALRLWFVAHMTRVVGDSLVYGDIAKTWLQHGVYGLSAAGPLGFRPTLIRMPGYPFFLAVCFRLFGVEHYHAVLNMQVAIDLATCCLASALAGRLFGARARLATLWIAALCPFTANYTATALSETLVLATIALAFYGFARWQDAGANYNRWLFVVAAALSYSILLRPEQGLLAAAVLPAMLWRTLAKSAEQTAVSGEEEPGVKTPVDSAQLFRGVETPRYSEQQKWGLPAGANGGSRGVVRRALPVVVAAVCVVLPLVPWTARNAYYFHVFQPLAPRNANDPGEVILHGYGHWYRAWAIDFAATFDFNWPMDGEAIDFAKLPQRAFDASTPAESAELRRQTAELIAEYNKELTLTPEIDARFDALAAELIDAHPLRYHVGLPMARVLDMALRPRTETIPIALEWWQWSRHPGQTTFATAYGALNLAFFVAAFAGLARWRRRGWAVGRQTYGELAAGMAACIVLRLALLLFIDNSEPRFTLEFFPVFFVWIGALFAAPDSSATV